MTAILKVDTIQDTSGNNIINENANTVTIGKAGDTVNVVGTLQNDGAALVTGKILQVVQATDSTQRNTTSTSFVDVGTLSVSITPSSTSNKVLVLASTNGRQLSGGDVSFYTIDRNGTNISPSPTNGFCAIQPQTGAATDNINITYLDSPSSTSALTYKLQFRNNTGTATASANWNTTTGTITVMEISA